MTQIITITASPTIDVSTSVGQLKSFSKLRCAPARRDPGGGGINVARVVMRMGGDVTAIYPAGGATGRLLCRLMELEGVAILPVTTGEDTRENFTVFEAATSQQYRFVLPGNPLGEQEWQGCLKALAQVPVQPAFVVASCSLPPGTPVDFYARVAHLGKGKRAKVVIDTSGPALRAALDEGVHLIKPNLREFQDLTGTNSDDTEALIDAGRSLIGLGRVEMIALTLGAYGAILMTRDRAVQVAGLPIKPASVVGAGDSFLGAMVWSLASQHNLDDALKYGVAAGSAALLNRGTELCRPEDVNRLFGQVVVSPGRTAAAREGAEPFDAGHVVD